MWGAHCDRLLVTKSRGGSPLDPSRTTSIPVESERVLCDRLGEWALEQPSPKQVWG